MANSKNSKEFSKKSVTGIDDLQARQPAKSKKESFSHKAGEVLERAGEKIKNAGAATIGNAVYKAGNKLEHSQDHKKSTH